MELKTTWTEQNEENLGDVRRRLFTGKNVMLARNVVKPRAVLSAHSHPHEQMILVLEGTCEAIIGENRFPMKTGDTALVPGGVEHQVISTYDGELILLDIFSPIREDFLK